MGQPHYMQGFENTEDLGQIWLEFNGLAADKSNAKTGPRTLMRVDTGLLIRYLYKARVERTIKPETPYPSCRDRGTRVSGQKGARAGTPAIVPLTAPCIRNEN